MSNDEPKLTIMTQSQPPITETTHTLPFDKLSPRDFERLCLRLVRREGYEHAEHLGTAGSEQETIRTCRAGYLPLARLERLRDLGL